MATKRRSTAAGHGQRHARAEVPERQPAHLADGGTPLEPGSGPRPGGHRFVALVRSGASVGGARTTPVDTDLAGSAPASDSEPSCSPAFTRPVRAAATEFLLGPPRPR